MTTDVQNKAEDVWESTSELISDKTGCVQLLTEEWEYCKKSLCCERYRVKFGGVGLTARNDVAWSESPLVFGYIRLRFHGIIVRANLKCVRDNRVMGYRHCLYAVN